MSLFVMIITCFKLKLRNVWLITNDYRLELIIHGTKYFKVQSYFLFGFNETYYMNILQNMRH